MKTHLILLSMKARGRRRLSCLDSGSAFWLLAAGCAGGGFFRRRSGQSARSFRKLVQEVCDSVGNDLNPCWKNVLVTVLPALISQSICRVLLRAGLALSRHNFALF